MNLKPEIYDELQKYSKSFPEEEVCGFIVEDQGFVKFISIENKHPQKNCYALISPKDYLFIKNNYKILYYFHSHPVGSDFSEIDLFYQKYHNLNMMLYDVANNIFKEKKCKII
jgi:proteasome lid subunit RPN8/RPN11